VSVEFFSREGILLGSRKTLELDIHAITGIPVSALQRSSLSDYIIRERLAWMGRRETTREEDRAYSLLGIFGVHMQLIYGEGKRTLSNGCRRRSALRRVSLFILPHPLTAADGASGAAEDRAKDDVCLADLRDTDLRDDKRRIERTKGGLLEGSD
jgi:hypothetical protein